MRTKLVLLPLASLVALTLGAGPALADGNAPAGNNGTIKIDGVPADDGNDNVPHPGCGFTVEFFGYDAGDRTARLEFDAQSPLEGGMLAEVPTRFTVAERTGGNQLNHRVEVDLADVLAGRTPHPKQGYHVKLTVHVDGAQGADVKHKVFWISECVDAGVYVAEAGTAVPAPTTTTTVAPTTTTAPAENGLGGAGGPGSGAVLGASEEAGTLGVGGELPRTGTTTWALALTALTLLAAGAALVATGRRPAA